MPAVSAANATVHSAGFHVDIAQVDAARPIEIENETSSGLPASRKRVRPSLGIGRQRNQLSYECG
jgi:hypothetical protein